MAVFNTVFFGDQSFPVTISGDESFNAKMDTVVEVLPDVYDGSLDIYPGGEIITLETAGKSMPGNVVVNPIPSNYGLITWNGAFLTVS